MSNQGLGSPCNSNVILQTSCENRKAYLQRGVLWYKNKSFCLNKERDTELLYEPWELKWLKPKKVPWDVMDCHLTQEEM